MRWLVKGRGWTILGEMGRNKGVWSKHASCICLAWTLKAQLIPLPWAKASPAFPLAGVRPNLSSGALIHSFPRKHSGRFVSLAESQSWESLWAAKLELENGCSPLVSGEGGRAVPSILITGLSPKRGWSWGAGPTEMTNIYLLHLSSSLGYYEDEECKRKCFINCEIEMVLMAV